MPPTSKQDSPLSKKMKIANRSPRTSILNLENDVLCILFSYLDIIDIVRSSAVCKPWREIIRKSRFLEDACIRVSKKFNRSNRSQPQSLGVLDGFAMELHRRSLTSGSVRVHQWRGHPVGVRKCHVKMNSLLTGVGDRLMRLWSLESFECIEEYPLPSSNVLTDFGLDESKIVGLLGSQLCIWMRKGGKTTFPQQEGTFPKGLCMRYIDPEAVIGCEDGTARVFDMYSKKCTRIIRMHRESATCIAFTEDRRIIAGSSLGRISLCSLSDQEVTTMQPTVSAATTTLSLNAHAHKVFVGSTSGFVTCYDVRMMGLLWRTRASGNVVYSVGQRGSDTLTMVVGGVDGVLRVVDQESGGVVAKYVMDSSEPRRLPVDSDLELIPTTGRPPILNLGVGMNKVATIHTGGLVRVWKFKIDGEIT